MKTFTIAEDTVKTSGTTKATHTYSLTSKSYTNTAGSTNIVIDAPTLKCKYNTTAGGRNSFENGIRIRPKVDGVSEYAFYSNNSAKNYSANTDYSMTLDVYFSPTKWTIPLSKLFTSDNSTSKSVSLNWDLYHPAGGSAMGYTSTGKFDSHDWVRIGWRKAAYNGTLNGEGTVTLNAPPTFDNSTVSLDTVSAYAGITTASVSVNNLSAKYGGDISDVKFQIGNQTANRSDAGTLSIALDTVGTFTPTITVTDSRGQTNTVTLGAITVLSYPTPSLSFSAERTDEDGKPNDEGESAVITATFKWTDALSDLDVPTVTVSDENGTAIQCDVSWYTTRNQNGTLSGLISDFSVLSDSDMPIYGLITDGQGGGVFNAQKSYQIIVTPIDDIESGTAIEQTLSTAFYTIDFLAGGHGIAFGQSARNEGFECAMQASFVDKGNNMTALVDLIHPVGSYYWTSDEDFVPADVFGGSWEQIDAGVTLVSAGTGYTVSSGTAKDGGNETATLGIANMPAHNHGEKSLTGYVTLRKTGAGYNTAVSRSGIVSSISTSGSGSTSVNGSGSSGQALDQVNFDATHTHDSQGSGTAFNIMNPYKCAYCWHRIG